MSKFIDLKVEIDHLESLTRASGVTAISELIWNSLDADATRIEIDYESNTVGGYESITVADNGLGLAYNKAHDVFSKLGGSEKKYTNSSPSGRMYHGKEGKGRYKSLALGDLVKFTSVIKNGDGYNEFDVIFDRNKITKAEISDLRKTDISTQHSGFKVFIQNVNSQIAFQAFNDTNKKEIEQKFASYWINYPDFSVSFNGKKLSFASLIKNTDEKKIFKKSTDKEADYQFNIKIIEWKFDIKKKTYLCNNKGIPFKEINLGIRTSLPISIFIESLYIETLQRENRIEIDGLDPLIQEVYEEAKKIARDYVRNRLHHYSGEFINDLKVQGLYPYKEIPTNVVEENTRKVFDIVALQVNEFLPDFEIQDKKSKKLTLLLIKEALEKDSSSLQKILSEVIDLPKNKREELVELLDETSLSSMIDTMTEIKNRLILIKALEELIYNRDLNKNILERKHLHKIIAKETWLFGDEYTYGVDDVTLKNVLKSYLKFLGKEDFEEIVESEDNGQLNEIPDVCLWKQYSLGEPGKKKNLVIELKRPSLDAGFTEVQQIKTYANKISSDKRFPKENTKWTFLLITKDVKDEIEFELNQQNRKYGHIVENENVDVFVLTWGHIFTQAKTRYEFIKEKLNLNLVDNESNLEFLQTKYSEYLPIQS
ncbi:ATP-binding protein [Chryseobacterium sp. C3]|uniref:ATP-binding protein n=1 Tax=Chryseobacterium sp. C3 TaxID=2761532 RepID=UPI001629342B|nr:ATP-binding protein [Chryseobacterium sp. C3]